MWSIKYNLNVLFLDHNKPFETEKHSYNIPGNSKSLWNAVNASKDIGASLLPGCMTLDGVKVNEDKRSSCFASYFVRKIKSITDNTLIDSNVYNGSKKLEANNEMFMSITEVEKCIKSIKINNSEGFDRIPQRILIEGVEHLLNPLSKL